MQNADNAFALYKKLSLNYIQNELLGKEFESNWLECKEKQRAEHPGADEGDVSAFAKALSGYANTGGGVLIYGLKAKKEGDVDCIISIKEISEIRRFASRLRELESRKVERLVQGVEYKIIPIAKGKPESGLLAIFVPKSKAAPHRSLVDNKFYIRAGGAFVPVGINQIEDLFQRGYHPELRLVVRRSGHHDVKIYLKNISYASAKDVYIVFSLPTGFHTTKYSSGGVRLSPCNSIGNYKDIPKSFIEFGTESRVVVHPGAEICVVTLVATDGKLEGKKLDMEYFVYADNMSEFHDAVTISFE